MLRTILDTLNQLRYIVYEKCLYQKVSNTFHIRYQNLTCLWISFKLPYYPRELKQCDLFTYTNGDALSWREKPGFTFG